MQKLWPEILFRGLDEKEKDELKRLLINSDAIRRIVKILKDQLSAEEGSTKADYESPSWAYKQADKNGAVRAYKYILTLLDHEEQHD